MPLTGKELDSRFRYELGYAPRLDDCEKELGYVECGRVAFAFDCRPQSGVGLGLWNESGELGRGALETGAASWLGLSVCFPFSGVYVVGSCVALEWCDTRLEDCRESEG